MNHFVGLVIISVVVAAVFSLLNQADRKEQLRHFFLLLGYMVAGSFLFAWLMYFLPF